MSVSTLSVILPTLNCRNRIQGSLREICDWLDLADEIIVVDSYSTDGTLELIRQELRHPNLTIISREPGFFESWNEAIQRSRGDWIYISTAGDTIKRSHLQHLIDTGRRLHADVVVSNARFLTGDGFPGPRREWPALKVMRALRLTSPTVLPPFTAQYFAFSAYPLAILGSSAANVYRGDHLRARPFPLDHGHAGDAAWLMRHAPKTRLCLTPQEGATFLIHDRDGPSEPFDHDAALLKEISAAQKASELSDLLRMFIDQELPIILGCRSLRSRQARHWSRDLPIAIRFAYRAWTHLLLREERARLFFYRSKIHRQIRAGMASELNESRLAQLQG